MKLNWQKRRIVREAVKSFAVYLLLVAVAVSVMANVLAVMGRLKMPEIFAQTQEAEFPKVREIITIKDVEVEYVERKVYLYLDREGNRWREFIITGYSANDPAQGTDNMVAANFDLDRSNVSRLPIAASNEFPLYSIVEIEGLGAYIILDRGLGYKTDYGWEDDRWIDILFDTRREAVEFGMQKRKVRLIQ